LVKVKKFVLGEKAKVNNNLEQREYYWETHLVSERYAWCVHYIVISHSTKFA
jgi:hypothetical protein